MRRSHLFVLLLLGALGAALWSFLEGPRPRSADPGRSAPSRETGPDAADAVAAPGRRTGVPDWPDGTPERERRAPAALGRDLTGKVVVTVRTHDGEPAAGVPVVGGSMDRDGAFVTLVGLYGLPRTDAFGRVGVDPEDVEERYAAHYFGFRQALADPGSPREIVLPPLGAVIVDLAAFDGETTVSLRGDGFGTEHATVEAGGTWRVDHVPLEETFRGVVRSGGRFMRYEVVGPVEPGEVVTWAPRSAATLHVRARPLDPDGASIADERYELLDAEGHRVCILDDDDGDGWVEADVEQERWYVAAGDSVELRERRVGVSDDGAPYVPLKAPEPDAEGVVDLGELRLAAPPLFAAGVVVDGRGRPVPYATVRVNRRQKWRPERIESALGLVGRSSGWGPADRDAHGPVARVAEAHADRAGGFELRVRPEDVGDPDRLVLVATSREPERSASQAPRPGATDHHLALLDDGTISADLSDFPDLNWGFVRATLHSLDRHAWKRQLGGPGGPVELAVPAGRYLLEVRFGLFLLAEVDGIVVTAGTRCADPRLAPVTPDPPIQRRRIDVRDAEGEPVIVDSLWYTPGSFVIPMSVFGEPYMPGDTPGHVTWYAVGDPEFAAFLGAQGYGAAEITDVPDGGSVTLERLVLARLLFEGASPPARGEIEWVRPEDSRDPPDSMEVFSYREPAAPPSISVGVVPGRRYRLGATLGSPWDGATFTAIVEDGAVLVHPK